MVINFWFMLTKLSLIVDCSICENMGVLDGFGIGLQQFCMAYAAAFAQTSETFGR